MYDLELIGEYLKQRINELKPLYEKGRLSAAEVSYFEYLIWTSKQAEVFTYMVGHSPYQQAITEAELQLALDKALQALQGDSERLVKQGVDVASCGYKIQMPEGQELSPKQNTLLTNIFYEVERLLHAYDKENFEFTNIRVLEDKLNIIITNKVDPTAQFTISISGFALQPTSQLEYEWVDLQEDNFSRSHDLAAGLSSPRGPVA